MMRYALVPLVIAVTTAMLFTSISSASACYCTASYPSVEDWVDGADAVIVGTVVGLREQGMVVSVDRYLKGSGATPILVRDPPPNLPPDPDGIQTWNNCNSIDHTALNREYLLLMRSNESAIDNDYSIGGCGLSGAALDSYVGDGSHPLLTQVEAITGPGQPPSGEINFGVVDAQLEAERSLGEQLQAARSRAIAIDNLPAEAQWAVAFAIPLAFIAGAMIWVRVKQRWRLWS